MKRNIPIYFDSVVITSPAQTVVSNPNLRRVKVGVFYKYGNRNDSYITDAIADELIASATHGDTPVIGFFDPSTENWASHTGPTLANGYGYIESFEGWQPFKDTDGVTRDYAVFSVVLFSKYFKEANFIVGQNQSMELDINSIEGDWANIDGHEYFVYTHAEMLGLCVIGNHEPCFSVSSFFSKNDSTYINQYDKFSSLLADLKAQVEEADKLVEGGEHQMEKDSMNPEVNEPTPAQEFVEQTPAVEPEAPANVPTEEPKEPEAPIEPEGNDAATHEPEGEEQTPAGEPVADFEAQIAELQNQITELTTNYESAQARIAELEAQITSATETENALRAEITTYEAERNRILVEKKNAIIEKYAAHINDEEQIAPIREQMNNFTCEELESKLAICFANKQMAGSAEEVVPLPDPVVDQFALLMDKYRKN